MGIIGQLTQKCSIYRKEVTYNDVGSPTETYSLISSNIKCRIQQVSSIYLSLTRGRDESSSLIGFFEIGTDIQQGDRIELEGNTYTVNSVDSDVGTVGHHMEVLLGT